MKPDRVAQCRANIRDMFVHHGLPMLEEVEMREERGFFKYRGFFTSELEKLVPEVFAPFNFVQNHGPTALCGWREEVATCSMQIIRHVDNLVEVDFDYNNPNYGLGLAVLHFFDLVFRPVVNSFKVAKKLRERGIPHIEV